MADTQGFIKASREAFPTFSKSEGPTSDAPQRRDQSGETAGCGQTFLTQGVGRVAVDDCDDIPLSVRNACAAQAVAAAFKQANAVCEGLRECRTLYFRPKSVQWWSSCEFGRLIITVTFECQCR